MANPQKENGYTPIANEVLEQVCKIKLNATQLKIIMVVWRYTYGFQRKTSGFAETFIAKATGIHKIHVSKEIKRLVEMNILIVAKEATFNTSRELEFNKNYSSWNCLQLANPLTLSENANTTVSENTNPTVSEFANQEIKHINKTIKKDICAFFDDLWKLYPRKIGKASVSQKTKQEIEKVGYDEMARAVERYKQYIADNGIEPKYIKHGSSFFKSGYLDYLDENYNADSEIDNGNSELPIVNAEYINKMQEAERVSTIKQRTLAEIECMTPEELFG